MVHWKSNSITTTSITHFKLVSVIEKWRSSKVSCWEEKGSWKVFIEGNNRLRTDAYHHQICNTGRCNTVTFQMSHFKYNILLKNV